jgi:LysM repeat protein
MDVKNWSGTLLTLLVLVIFNCSAHSQVVIERSKDKVIISGVPYYVHIVKKGETAYSISRAYGIAINELIKENPSALYGVNEGMALRIPVKAASEQTEKIAPQIRDRRDESKFIYHTLKPGETIYFLSKAYGVSENEIISANPGVDLNKIPVNSEIAIPKREFMSDKQKFNDQNSKIIYHKVVKGESLASIASKYGLTVRELRKENRNTRFPQVGEYLRVPNLKFTEIESVAPIVTDTVKIIPELPAVVYERPAGYTPVKNLKGSLNVAVILPFYLAENSQRSYIDSSKSVKGKKIKKLINRPEGWIYDRDFIELYQGILIAADTLSSLGLDINLNVFDIKSDSSELISLIKQGKLEGMDLIIGPVWSENLSIVAAYAGPLGIPVVSPVLLYNNKVLENNPSLFLSNSTLGVAQKALAKKVSEYYDHNFVFIHADTSGSDQDVKNFKAAIISELSNKMPFEEIRFKEFIFYSRSAFENDSINRLAHALSEKENNMIIIASEDGPVISETIQEIHGLLKKFDMKLFGYPAMRDLINQNNLDPKYYFDLSVMLYSPFWIDFNKMDVRHFNSDFRGKFLTEPSEMSYSWQGYDITYYFLSGLALYGKEFLNHPEIHNPDLLQTQYDFRRAKQADGFENQKLYLIKYSNNYVIELVDEKNSKITE